MQIFPGNSDRNTANKNILQQAVQVKFFQITPTDYNFYPTLRVELYGIVQGKYRPICFGPLSTEEEKGEGYLRPA